MKQWLAYAVCGWTGVLGAAAVSPVPPLTVRILPQPVATNREPLRLGFRVGPHGEGVSALAAECLPLGQVEAGFGALPDVQTSYDPNADMKLYQIANGGSVSAGVSLNTLPLRRGVGYTVRATCRWVSGSGALQFVFAPEHAAADVAVEKVVSIGDDAVEKAFSVHPTRDGVFTCSLLLPPNSEMAFCGFSMRPDDAEGEWDYPALVLLRKIAPEALQWPAGGGAYDWYDGVGPRALRPGAGTNDFGTAEYVALCRQMGVEPQIRVPVSLEAGSEAVQSAAEWVAYCNATNDSPLAALRRRHGRPDPLAVKRWELVVPEGAETSSGPWGKACRAYAAALRAEDPAVQIAFARPSLTPTLYDRYTAGLLEKLAVGDAAERLYYSEWYETLSVARTALARLQSGRCDASFLAPFTPDEAFARTPTARAVATGAGLLMATVNRFPARTPLAVEGALAEADAPLQIVAAWSDAPCVLTIFLCNSAPEARDIVLDLSPLKRRFAFWVADQMAGGILKPRKTERLPVDGMTKGGAVVSPMLRYACPPASFVRIAVRE